MLRSLASLGHNVLPCSTPVPEMVGRVARTLPIVTVTFSFSLSVSLAVVYYVLTIRPQYPPVPPRLPRFLSQVFKNVLKESSCWLTRPFSRKNELMTVHVSSYA